MSLGEFGARGLARRALLRIYLTNDIGRDLRWDVSGGMDLRPTIGKERRENLSDFEAMDGRDGCFQDVTTCS
jgi:hypothetical protein